MELPFSASEGRRLVGAIVTELHRFGAVVRQIGVYPTQGGLLFVAEVNGRLVSVATPDGEHVYRTLAMELLTATLAPSPDAVITH